ncbi:HAD family hydrolase [Marinicauda algicola]|uniref:D,D-heptose 1,7-bisphosphate phosphatase n=1 Tax=Marinicauda algicola TaxID=2029849 RepID=A0A4S2H3Y6_9PROT|nr:HAD family hydrolase [Marinicauda algicola]TGY90306.1 HAD family hydrolase [Marinicauda algicola]
MTGRSAIFLDRDGVLNVDHGYTHDPASLQWQPGAREAMALIKQAGYLAIVVTNQAGIGRGYYTEAQMHAFHEAMNRDLARHGCAIDAFYFCAYHPEASRPEFRHRDHPDRKPNPGMILKAIADWGIDPARSLLIGDRDTDVTAARRAGVAGHIYQGGRLDDLIRGLLPGRPASGSGR